MKKYDPLRDPHARRLMDSDPEFARHYRNTRKKAEKSEWYRREARTDYLTGLLNKRGFDEALDKELARSKRHGHPLTLGFGDIRGFKKFNDRYGGHMQGDRVLKCIAASLEENLREEDYAARVYGDEFGVICVEAPSDTAKSLIKRIVHHTCRLEAKKGAEIDVPVSMRFALVTYPDIEADGAVDLFEKADRALNIVREKGCSIYIVSEDILIP